MTEREKLAEECDRTATARALRRSERWSVIEQAMIAHADRAKHERTHPAGDSDHPASSICYRITLHGIPVDDREFPMLGLCILALNRLDKANHPDLAEYRVNPFFKRSDKL